MLICKFLLLLITLFPAALLHADTPPPPQSVPIRIGTIVFAGNQGISTRQLKLLLRMSPEGSEYIPANLQIDLRNIEKAYRDSGYLRIRLGAPEIEVQSAENKKIAAIRIVVEKGPQYGTGKLSVTNANALAPGTLVQLSPLQKGHPYSSLKAEQWQAKVEDSYREMGYLKARCPVRETINEAGKTVDCTMECAEGRLYKVGKITVNGDRSVNPSELKRRLLFSEGGIFNPEMLPLSIQFINQAHYYEPISDSDVEIRIDDDQGKVDIELHVVARVR